MKYKYLALPFIGILIFYLFFPISVEQSMARAEDELSYYCTDLNLDCSKYKRIGLIEDKKDLRIYGWDIADGSDTIIYIRVPYRRIGDLTFGLIGKDVTLGGFTKQNN